MVVTDLPATAPIGSTQQRVADAVDVHGAGAAERHAAAVLGARQAELVPEHPEQGHVVRGHRPGWARR